MKHHKTEIVLILLALHLGNQQSPSQENSAIQCAWDLARISKLPAFLNSSARPKLSQMAKMVQICHFSDHPKWQLPVQKDGRRGR